MDQSTHTQNQSQKVDPLLNKTYFSKYVIKKKLGEGSFGRIYLSESNNNATEKYALKFESRTRGQNLLESEAKIMKYLYGPGIPSITTYGFSGDYNILVMQLLGKSLEDILNELPTKKMSMRTTCNLGYQMVTILEYIHSRHIIHRDIKPDNFVMGIDNKTDIVYLLDFGLAKKYRSSRTLKHNPLTNKKKLTGTARYASINALKGLEQSRRDDLEALGYVLMYFLRGNLPWQGLPIKNKEDRYLKIMEKKKDTSSNELCEGFPKYFADFIEYTRKLEYEDDPDYSYLKSLFVSSLNEAGFELDKKLDWLNGSSYNNNNCNDSSAGKDSEMVKKQTDMKTITVVNNYYHNVNNIVINPSNSEKEKKQKNNNNILNTDKNMGTSLINNLSNTFDIKNEEIIMINHNNNNNKRTTQKEVIQIDEQKQIGCIDIKGDIKKDRCCIIF